MRVGILTILLSFTSPTVSLSASAQADFSAILVEVLDGDTIKDIASGAVIRLNGIDACEANQFATTQSGQRFNCGILPAARLIEWTSDQRLNCVVSGQDKYGRYLATCATTSIRDIGAQLIQEGLAVAY